MKLRCIFLLIMYSLAYIINLLIFLLLKETARKYYIVRRISKMQLPQCAVKAHLTKQTIKCLAFHKSVSKATNVEESDTGLHNYVSKATREHILDKIPSSASLQNYMSL